MKILRYIYKQPLKEDPLVTFIEWGITEDGYLN